jgi:3-hydroxyacyl-[acyl-carrier-protein] dehydratase
MLIGDYFTIEKKEEENTDVIFSVKLNPEHKVYEGHFPGMPVCPGVCNVQMIKECIEENLGKEFLIDTIGQCKFSSLITPLENRYLKINTQVTLTDELYKVKATVTNQDNTVVFIQFKADFKVQP